MDVCRTVRDNFSIVVVCAVFLLILILARNYLFIGIFALSLAVVMLPLHRRMIGKLPAWLSAGILTTVITGAIVAACMAIVIVLLSDVDYLVEMFRTIFSAFTQVLDPVAAGTYTDSLVTYVSNLLTTLFPKLLISAAGFVPQVLIDMVIFYALLYVCILFGDRVWGDIWSVLPETARPNIGLMAEKTRDILYSLYIVHVFIAVLTFFLAYGFFMLLGYGHVPFYAMLCAVFALIPFLGPVMVLIFVGVYALSLGDWRGVILICTAGYFLLCVVTDIILRPKLTGRKVQIRPMLMFLGFFGGAMIMGLLGFVLGPVLLVLAITGYEIFFREMREKKSQNL